MLRQFVAKALRGSISSRIRMFSELPAMLCNQCEQTLDCNACTGPIGVCGKDAETSTLQDLLIATNKGLASLAEQGRKIGVPINMEMDKWTVDSMFSTITNVNFSPSRLREFIISGLDWQDVARSDLEKAGGVALEDDFTQLSFTDEEGMLQAGLKLGIAQRKLDVDENILSIQEIVMGGLKGVVAYQAHAIELGKDDESIHNWVVKALAAYSDPALELGDWLSLALECGEVNLKTMELLSEGHREKFGIPTPTPVRLAPVEGKAILISGHDMVDLQALLEQTEGTGINVYTHGEMLPAHGYPELKKFPHLAGHIGTAWQNQRSDFGNFPGPVVLTTNCLMPPRKKYIDRVFTMNSVGFDGCPQVHNRDFSAVVAKALSCEGYATTEPESETRMVGFGHDAILGIADAVVGLVKAGTVERFVLIGGCDGSEGERSYYTDLAAKLPGCGKYRITPEVTAKMGNIPGTELPRVLDMGQCNDSYSAIRVAAALADVFECGLNDLPLSIVLSWFEQKAVAVLLTLLHLGVKNIRVGPRLPAFITPAVLDVLVEKFNLIPVGGECTDAEVASVMGKA